MLTTPPDMLWWLLVLIPVIPLIWWRTINRQRRLAVPWSTVTPAAGARRGLIARTRWILPCLRTLAIIMLAICLVGPMKGDQYTSKAVEGVAIELVIDRSGSMRALDMEVGGRQFERLDVVKAVAADFVLGEAALPGREHDLIGLITFGTFADSICPMTLDYRTLTQALEQVTPASGEEGANTSIGDAVALATSRLADLEDRHDLDTDDIRSKVIVLLTDGEDTASEIHPLEAAEIAEALGVRIYTIGVGRNGIVPVAVEDRQGRRRIEHRQSQLDETVLRQMAEMTGGAFFRAQDTQSLSRIYAAIDELERTEISEEQFYRFTDLAVAGVTIGTWKIPALLIVPLILLLIEAVLATTRYRTMP